MLSLKLRLIVGRDEADCDFVTCAEGPTISPAGKTQGGEREGRENTREGDGY